MKHFLLCVVFCFLSCFLAGCKPATATKMDGTRHADQCSVISSSVYIIDIDHYRFELKDGKTIEVETRGSRITVWEPRATALDEQSEVPSLSESNNRMCQIIFKTKISGCRIMYAKSVDSHQNVWKTAGEIDPKVLILERATWSFRVVKDGKVIETINRVDCANALLRVVEY